MAHDGAPLSHPLPPAAPRDLFIGAGTSITVALAGAGGKHTLMEALISPPPRGAPPTVVTSTTRLHRMPCFDALPTVRWTTPGAASQLEQLSRRTPTVLVVADTWGEQMWRGIAPEAVASLRRAVPDACILAKADGARKRLLKAPGDGEPAWPAATQVAILVLSLAACGKPVDARWVHRPERVAALSRDRRIDPGTLVDVVLGPDGYGRRFPAGARRILYLSSCETSEQVAMALEVTGALSPHFERIVAGDTPQGRFLSLHG